MKWLAEGQIWLSIIIAFLQTPHRKAFVLLTFVACCFTTAHHPHQSWLQLFSNLLWACSSVPSLKIVCRSYSPWHADLLIITAGFSVTALQYCVEGGRARGAWTYNEVWYPERCTGTSHCYSGTVHAILCCWCFTWLFFWDLKLIFHYISEANIVLLPTSTISCGCKT